MKHRRIDDAIPGLEFLELVIPFRLVPVAMFGGSSPQPIKAAAAPPPPSPATATTTARTLIAQQQPRRGFSSTILTGPGATDNGFLQSATRTTGASILGIPLHE